MPIWSRRGSRHGILQSHGVLQSSVGVHPAQCRPPPSTHAPSLHMPPAPCSHWPSPARLWKPGTCCSPASCQEIHRRTSALPRWLPSRDHALPEITHMHPQSSTMLQNTSSATALRDGGNAERSNPAPVQHKPAPGLPLSPAQAPSIIAS